ncbi:MAG: hypothetical protein HY979_00675 [Candidatus Magasanikbacteria bacterium]|nr:hypothetical protein [Candidatus Magasanikbacteria bacterium]
MGRESFFERVVGDLPEGDEERLLNQSRERFQNQEFPDLAGREKEKTPEEVQIIFLANEVANEVVRQYGADDFDIPPKNVHIIKKEEWHNDSADANFQSYPQAIAIKDIGSKILLAEMTAHEMIHFKSYGSLHVPPSEKPVATRYRTGLEISSQKDEKLYFTNLNEAITQRLTIQAFDRMKNDPIFADEIRKVNQLRARYANAKGPDGKPIFTDDTLYACGYQENQGNIFQKIFRPKPTRITTIDLGYRDARQNLDTLIKKIKEHSADPDIDEEKIFAAFVRGMITGKILPIARLVDKNLGKGTFRKLGELGSISSIKEQKEFIDSL